MTTNAQETVDRMRQGGVVGIIRAVDPDTARQQARRCLDAGLGVLEVSLTTPDAVRVIGELSREYAAVVGAGTVLDRRSAEACIAAGARVLVSPTLVPEVIEVAVAHDVAVVPGCLTPTEMSSALRLGASAAKIFPAHLWSPAALRGMLQALPDLPCVPTGGVGPDSAAQWIEAGAIAVGVGGALTAADDPGKIVAALEASIGQVRDRG